MLDEPKVEWIGPRSYASLRLKVPRREIRDVMGPGLTEVMDAVAAQSVPSAGSWFTHHFRMDPEVFDFEIGLPLSRPIQPAGRIQPGTQPRLQVVRSVYHGPYEGLGDAWGELDSWIAARGLNPAGELWEVYLTGPEASSNPEDWKTELNRPLAGPAE